MISKNKLKLLLRLLITVTLCKGDSVIKKFYFTFGENDTIKMTWEEARRQCRSEDLNLITKNTVNEAVLTANSSDLTVVWLGLIRDSVNDSAWNWINTQYVYKLASRVILMSLKYIIVNDLTAYYVFVSELVPKSQRMFLRALTGLMERRAATVHIYIQIQSGTAKDVWKNIISTAQ